MAGKDLTGCKFGKWTVLQRAKDYVSPRGKKSPRWKCKCECGKVKEIVQTSLLSGSSLSCGCSRYDSKRKHGMCKTKLYNIWSHMKQRCNGKNNKRYKDYGGRGISYCKEWEDFCVFSKWAMESGYKDGLSIERKDVNGNYCPENCIWIPFLKQARNRRPSLRLSDENGNERIMVDLAEEFGISADVVRARYENGWDLKKAVYTPLIMQTVKKPVLKIDMNTGKVLKKYKSIGQAAKDVGIDRSGISNCCSGKQKYAGGYFWSYAEN